MNIKTFREDPTDLRFVVFPYNNFQPEYTIKLVFLIIKASDAEVRVHS